MVLFPSGRVATLPETGDAALRCEHWILLTFAGSDALRESERPMPTVPAGLLQSAADARWGSSSGQPATWPQTLAGSQGAMRCSASWGACAPAGGEVLA